MIKRRKIVGVMGSGKEAHNHLAAPLGRWLAKQGYNLLTGGGQGVMAAVSKAFASVPRRKGVIIGIIPAKQLYENSDRRNFQKPEGYPNEWVEVPIITHLPLTGKQGKEKMSRNHINILSSDIIIALPGGEGTLSEIELALEYGKPIIIFDPTSTMFSFWKKGLSVCTSLAEVISYLKAYN